jgi:steroid 5-alpha reductase family enzyme
VTNGLLIAAFILTVVVGVWTAIDRAWQLLLLAVAVALVILAAGIHL